MSSRLVNGDVVRGQQKCEFEDCGKIFNWVFLYWDSSSGSVVKMPKKRDNEEHLQMIDYNHARCHCNHCQGNNFFDLDFNSIKG